MQIEVIIVRMWFLTYIRLRIVVRWIHGGGGALAGIRRLLDAAKVQQIFKKTIIMEDLFTRNHQTPI